MSVPKKEKRSLRLLGTGFTMGLADLVPGVSGGTIALLFGIYDELIYSIKLVTGKVIKLLLKGRISETMRLIPFSFLVPVFAGLLLAIVTMVEVVTYGLDKYPVYVWSLFFGLIIGSAYVVSGRVRSWSPARLALLFLGAVSIFLLVGLPTATGDSSLLSAGLTGAIAIVAMILPGISGSLIMVILGQYENIIHAVSDRDFATLGVFALGAIVGLALFSRILSWLLKNYHNAVLAFLIGMMIGSLRKVWPWQEQVSEKLYKNVAPELAWSLVASIVLMLVGFALVWKLEKSGIAKDHDDIHSKEFKKTKHLN
jgi:putative membrane protein